MEFAPLLPSVSNNRSAAIGPILHGHGVGVGQPSSSSLTSSLLGSWSSTATVAATGTLLLDGVTSSQTDTSSHPSPPLHPLTTTSYPFGSPEAAINPSAASALTPFTLPFASPLTASSSSSRPTNINLLSPVLMRPSSHHTSSPLQPDEVSHPLPSSISTPLMPPLIITSSIDPSSTSSTQPLLVRTLSSPNNDGTLLSPNLPPLTTTGIGLATSAPPLTASPGGIGSPMSPPLTSPAPPRGGHGHGRRAPSFRRKGSMRQGSSHMVIRTATDRSEDGQVGRTDTTGLEGDSGKLTPSGSVRKGEDWFADDFIDDLRDEEEPRCPALHRCYNRLAANRASLFLFPPKSSFRILVAAVVRSKWFEYGVLILILVNCIILAMSDPLTDSDDDFQNTGISLYSTMLLLLYTLLLNSIVVILF
jgi:hypothetical protein